MRTRSSPAAATAPSSPPRSSKGTPAASWSRWPRIGETADLLTGLGYQTGGVQLQASRLAPLPGGPRVQFRLAAQNPVFVLWGQR